MGWGSVADWVGALGGAASAGSAATFYWMDRRRNAADRHDAAVQKGKDRATLIDEVRTQIDAALSSLSSIEERHDIYESTWGYLNGILSNHQRRLSELAVLSDPETSLRILIGSAADALAFARLPLEHVQLWRENIAIAEGALQRQRDVLDRTNT